MVILAAQDVSLRHHHVQINELGDDARARGQLGERKGGRVRGERGESKGELVHGRKKRWKRRFGVDFLWFV